MDIENYSLVDNIYEILNINLNKIIIVKSSLILQESFGQNKEEFIKCLETDMFYGEVVTSYSIEFKNIFNLCFESFENFDYKKSLQILRNLISSINNNNENESDIVILYKIKNLYDYLKDIINSKIRNKNYTKIIS